VTAWGVVLTILLGLMVNEMTDISPWLAHRIVRWAAYRWSPDAEIAAGYAEEWAAIIDERPGRLFKLGTAVGFAGAAAFRTLPRRLEGLRAVWRSLPRQDQVEVAKAAHSIIGAAGLVSVTWGTWSWILVFTVLGGVVIWSLSAWSLIGIARRARAARTP
jgi:hypothetical protein